MTHSAKHAIAAQVESARLSWIARIEMFNGTDPAFTTKRQEKARIAAGEAQLRLNRFLLDAPRAA